MPIFDGRAGARQHAGITQTSPFLLLSEIRAAAEALMGAAASPLLALAPRGDGHPVLVLPAFLGSDVSTTAMRAFLGLAGSRPHGWEQGLNLGGIRRMDRPVQDRVRALHKAAGRKVSLIGWSLGGIYARRAALALPGMVRQVITLGTPFTADAKATHTPAEPLLVPITAVLSRTDGVVNWRACMVASGSRAENVEIRGASHFGMSMHPAIFWLLADRLAQPEGTFRPFAPSGPFAIVYGT